MVVDRILIELGLDTKQLDKGIATAQNKLITGFSGIAKKVFAPLLAGMTLSFGAIFDSLSAELKQMNALSKATHTNIEEITAWSRAVTMSGGTIDGFQQSLMFLNQNLTRIAVTGHSRIKPFFEALGLDAVELAKKPVLDSLGAIGKSIDGMDKRQSANMLRSMGFDAGTIKLLQSGEKNIKKLIARQKELGVYTAKDAKALAEMNRGIKEITSAIKTLFIPVFSMIMSVASRVIKYLTAGVLFLRKNLDAIKTVLLGVALVMSGKLVPAFIGFLDMLMTNPLGAFLAAFGSLFLLFDDLYTYAEGGESAFEEFWAQFGTPKEIMQTFDNIIKKVSDFLKLIGDFKFDESNLTAWVVLGGLIGVAAAGLTAFLMSLGAIPIAIGAAIAFVIAYGQEIVEAFRVIGKMILSIFEMAGNAIGNALSSAADVARSAWNSFISWLEEKWNWIKSLLPSITGIMNKLPSFGSAPQLASAGAGGGSYSETNDNRKVDVHLNTGEATRTFMKESNLTGFGNSGTRR